VCFSIVHSFPMLQKTAAGLYDGQAPIEPSDSEQGSGQWTRRRGVNR